MFIEKRLPFIYASTGNNNATIAASLAFYGIFVRTKNGKEALKTVIKKATPDRDPNFGILYPGHFIGKVVEDSVKELEELNLIISPEKFGKTQINKIKKGLQATAIYTLYNSDFFGFRSTTKILLSLSGDFFNKVYSVNNYGISLSQQTIVIEALGYSRFIDMLTREQKEEALDSMKTKIYELVENKILPEITIDQYLKFEDYLFSSGKDRLLYVP
jgi:hypothetical protein